MAIPVFDHSVQGITTVGGINSIALNGLVVTSVPAIVIAGIIGQNNSGYSGNASGFAMTNLLEVDPGNGALGILYWIPTSSGTYNVTLTGAAFGFIDVSAFVASYTYATPLSIRPQKTDSKFNTAQQSTTYSLTPVSDTTDLVLHIIGNGPNISGTPTNSYAASESQRLTQFNSANNITIALAEKAGASTNTTVSFNVGTSVNNNFNYATAAFSIGTVISTLDNLFENGN